MTGQRPHAYRPGCKCETCTGIQTATDRAQLRRMAIADGDWSGVATTAAIPSTGTETA